MRLELIRRGHWATRELAESAAKILAGLTGERVRLFMTQDGFLVIRGDPTAAVPDDARVVEIWEPVRLADGSRAAQQRLRCI